MIRRPPRSTPFPTRRSSDLEHDHQPGANQRRLRAVNPLERDDGERRREDSSRQERSEEHTSELQSRQYLVCRLLLEKKNTQPSTSPFSSASSQRMPVLRS